MQALLDAVVEPHRREILALLLERERLVGELADELGLGQPAVSKHLRVMREAGLVTARVDGPRRWYRLVAEPLAALDTWLEPYRRVWVGRLDALERHLDTMEDP